MYTYVHLDSKTDSSRLVITNEMVQQKKFTPTQLDLIKKVQQASRHFSTVKYTHSHGGQLKRDKECSSSPQFKKSEKKKSIENVPPLA